MINISFEDKVVLVLVISLSCGVSWSGCEVVLVNRNVKDSFRVGKDGCTNETSVCDVPNRAATCEPDSGLCLCPDGVPNFRNPILKSSGGSLQYGNTYGCVKNAYVRVAPTLVSEIPTCLFTPFKVIPYNHHDPVTKFSHDPTSVTLQSCSLLKAWAKFPDNYTETELQWLNESYVDLNIKSNYMLEFRWKKSVPDLRGTIITFSLKCYTSPSSYRTTCLRAKVLGMWSADSESMVDSNPTTKHPSSIKAKTTSSATATASKNRLTTTTTTVAAKIKTTANAISNECSCDANISNKVFYAVLAVSLLVNLVLGFSMGYSWKKRESNEDKNLKMKEMQSIGEQQRPNSGDYSPYDEVSVKRNKHNDGAFSTPGRNNNGRLSDDYEEPSNYQSLKREKDLSDEHNYQSLVK